MSTLKVTTIQDTSGGNSSTTAEIKNGIAKAWVNFNGTGTVAIRAQYNVSSITDNGNGDYTVNFATALVDANYAALFSTTQTGGAGPVLVQASGSVPTTTTIRLGMGDATALKDVAYNYVAIFR
jgi:hypothetical protein